MIPDYCMLECFPQLFRMAFLRKGFYHCFSVYTILIDGEKCQNYGQGDIFIAEKFKKMHSPTKFYKIIHR